MQFCCSVLITRKNACLCYRPSEPNEIHTIAFFCANFPTFFGTGRSRCQIDPHHGRGRLSPGKHLISTIAGRRSTEKLLRGRPPCILLPFFLL